MTPEQWLSKHYPVPASELAEASDEECLLHSINKWEGAKEENLPDRMVYGSHCISSHDDDGLMFDTVTGKPEKPRPSGRGGIGRHA